MRKANLEIKKLQEEVERVKKCQDNKSKILQDNLSSDLEIKEQEHKDALDALV